MVRIVLVLLVCFVSIPRLEAQEHSIARQWNEVLLQSIRNDLARPTVHARNLFHHSVAMYDIWAVYDGKAQTYFLGNIIGEYISDFEVFTFDSNTEEAREEAISYASLRLLKHRFQFSPNSFEIFREIDGLFNQLGYDQNLTSTDYQSGDPAAFGNYVAQQLIQFGLTDGSNEIANYQNRYYEPLNGGLTPRESGVGDITDPNRWQPLEFETFVDQSGNPISGGRPDFLSAEWGNVIPFSMTNSEANTFERDGFIYKVYHDPGPPVYLDTTTKEGPSELYRWNHQLVSVWSSHLDPEDETLIDIAPSSLGNIGFDDLPESFEEYRSFYDLTNGGDPGVGYDVNPSTGMPYEPQLVKRADYARILAEFWADGPDSETPPGHWFDIMNYVSDHPQLEKKLQGEGDVLSDLEWDIKSYFLLGGAMHDAAIAAWSVKGYYDYIRPISAIRYMASKGQSSDETLPNYHPAGVDLIPGFIELVQDGDPLAGPQGENIGEIKVFAWRGHFYIRDPETTYAGVGWILAADWNPYQRQTFVTPPFAGYVSGHSTYSRAAAEVLTQLTGDPFFPGGMGEFPAIRNEFLVFEEGPTADVTLQWATYRDASDQCSLSRIWGGIHPPIDDIPGRRIGRDVGVNAFNYGIEYFSPGIEVEEGQHVLYPNPVTDFLNVVGESSTFRIMGLNGQFYALQSAGRNGITQLDVRFLDKGVYLLLGDNNRVVGKFIKE
ncbi:DUF6851 domain-containing protein [Roseivirga sp.]|uniref:DUF6851 domain-containing protein n=1 Tax=Roseivirga sp. TaxID=1964215 RepID=UPI003B8DEEFE